MHCLRVGCVSQNAPDVAWGFGLSTLHRTKLDTVAAVCVARYRYRQRRSRVYQRTASTRHTSPSRPFRPLVTHMPTHTCQHTHAVRCTPARHGTLHSLRAFRSPCTAYGPLCCPRNAANMMPCRDIFFFLQPCRSKTFPSRWRTSERPLPRLNSCHGEPSDGKYLPACLPA